MNTKLKALANGDVGTSEVEAILNELIGIAQRGAHVKVANKTGGPLAKGTLVALTGYDATLAAPTVVKADANTGPVPAQAILSELIADGGAGIAYTCGVVTGLDTSGASAVGSKAYLGETPGAFAWAAPSDPGDVVQVVGFCTVKSDTAGALLFWLSAASGGVVEGAYVKPATGIPSTDMTTAVQTSLGLADSAYQLPVGGIPVSDMETDAQTAFALAAQAIVAIGGLFLVSRDLADGSSAAAVTAAAAGAKKKSCTLALQDAQGATVTWYTGPVTITPTADCVDEDIGLPVVTGGNTVTLTAGVGTVEITFDTDEGVANTYAADDEIGWTAAIGDILGETVDVSDALFLDTLIA